MRVRVAQTFRDKDNYTLIYKVGEEREFAENRAQHLISLGLVEPISIAQEEAGADTAATASTQRKRGRKPAKQVIE